MGKKPLITIISYTDPYCTWCWGSEPILRHLQTVYGEQLKLVFKMGGLVKDMADFYDPQNQISTMAQVAPHWRQAGERHGMPVDESIFLDPANDFHSTYPANIAYKAAEFQSSLLAGRYLRRLREAAAAEHKFIHRLEVQARLAAEVGLDVKLWRTDMENGRAEQAFRNDLQEARNLDIHGFPTFIIQVNNEETTLYGYHPFSTFIQIIEKSASEKINRRQPPDILGFIKQWRRVATQEIAETFDLSKEEAKNELEKLRKQGSLKRQTAGNGFFWEYVNQ